MDLATCAGGDFVVGDLACFTGDDDGVDGPRNEASRAAISDSDKAVAARTVRTRTFSSFLMTTAPEENLLRSEAELKLDLVSRLSLH